LILTFTELRLKILAGAFGVAELGVGTTVGAAAIGIAVFIGDTVAVVVGLRLTAFTSAGIDAVVVVVAVRATIASDAVAVTVCIDATVGTDTNTRVAKLLKRALDLNNRCDASLGNAKFGEGVAHALT